MQCVVSFGVSPFSRALQIDGEEDVLHTIEMMLTLEGY